MRHLLLSIFISVSVVSVCIAEQVPQTGLSRSAADATYQRLNNDPWDWDKLTSMNVSEQIIYRAYMYDPSDYDLIEYTTNQPPTAIIPLQDDLRYGRPSTGLIGTATHARGTNATYLDSNGYTNIATGARIDAFVQYSTVSAPNNFYETHAYYGEGAGTNLVTYSDGITATSGTNGWYWEGFDNISSFPDQLAAPEAGNPITADTIEVLSNGSNRGAYALVSGLGALDGRTFCFSIWVKKKGSATTATIRMLDSDNAETIGDSNWALPADGSWRRIYGVGTFTAAATGTGIRAFIHPGKRLSQTDGEALVLSHAQLEEWHHPTSFIPTSGTSATRAADTLSLPSAGVLDDNRGSLRVEYLPQQKSAATLSISRWALLLHSGTPATGFFLGRRSYTDSMFSKDGTAVNDIQYSYTWPDVIEYQVWGLYWDGSAKILYHNGDESNSVYDGSWDDDGNIYIGGGASGLNGYIRNIYFWDEALLEHEIIYKWKLRGLQQ